MTRALLSYGSPINPFAWWEDGFTNEELNYLQDIAKNNTQAGLVGGSNNNPNIRRSEVSWLCDDEKHSWVFDKIAHISSSLNSEFFRFNLRHFSGDIQLSNYSEKNQGTYNWHQDFGAAGVYRKLSLVLQLTDPQDYEGGELQILNGKTETSMNKQRGLVFAFPSWTVHRVTPVTKGSRQTMVIWLAGEPFQ